MKKILDIVPYDYLPYYSGGQKSIALFLEHLGKETDLTVVTVAENDFTLMKEYKTVPLLKKKSAERYSDLSLVSKLTALIKKEKFDAVIWEHPYYAWLAWLIKKRTGVKTVIRSHNIEYQRFRSMGKWWWPLMKMYERWCFRTGDYIFFVAPEDMQFSIRKWKIKEGRCIVIPFGIQTKEYPPDKEASKKTVKEKFQIGSNEKIFLFNGLLDYKPNLDALLVIIKEINPRLLATTLSYKIIICGKRLPAELNDLKEYADKNIIYAGFVDDVEMYFKAADIFLNPVQTGGGVKTKMVESIGLGTTVVATESGAAGIDKTVCGNKLVVVPDNDWKQFTTAVICQAASNERTPQAYYEKYYWGNAVKQIAEIV